MRKLLLAIVLALLPVGAAQAILPGRVALVERQPLGAPGFYPSCSSNFAVTNYVLQSGSLTTAPWATGSTGAAAPTVTGGQAAPDGTTTAVQVALPAVATGQNSYIDQQLPTSVTVGPLHVISIWVKGAVGGENIWLATTDGTTTSSQHIVATTSWQRVQLLTSFTNSANQFLDIGVITTIGAGTPQSAQTVYLWQPQATVGTQLWPPVTTTTTAASQTFARNCPPGTAFRKFDRMIADPQNPLMAKGAGGGTYTSGAPGLPQMQPWQQVSGTWFSVSACTPTGSNWTDMCQYTSTDLRNWTYSGINPAVAATASGWDDHYLVFAGMAPIKIGGAWYLYYSAMTAAGASAIGLATSTDPIGAGWTKHGTAALITGNSAAPTPSLPSVYEIGSTLYMNSFVNNNSGTYNVIWTSPATDGLNWSLRYFGLRAAVSGDWDSGSSADGYDPHVSLNRHGFYEAYYTALFSPSQFIGYMVSKNGVDFWKRDDKQIFDASSPSFTTCGITGAQPGVASSLENAGSFEFFYAVSDSGTNGCGAGAAMADW